MKNPWIAATLNFFFMGPGYIYNGKRVMLGVLWTIGAIILTYVELKIKSAAPDYYWMMFGGIFLINICFAIDGYNEAKSIK